MAARPITDTDREQVKALHAEGMSRNDIARRMKRSPSTVSKLAAEQGLTFERGPEVVAATEARRIDLAARRQALAEQLHQDAEQLRAQLWEPCTIGEFAGREGDWQTADLPRPRFADQRQIMGATATAIQQSLRLQPADGGADAGDVRSMLGSLGEALTGAFADDPGKDGG
ncbi:helix-turn-helix DNA binding protein [Streptomyces phage PapayaSalad]|uniref:Helix-turn-helix DNA binding protein n=1 Tax=Streptomyces phage PapayaSalad TaxID=1920310 RepID=A0A1J0MCI5_9CAUD|nr:helix-turn-helix domain-containing protein [Streptomyces phage PapayaSalad]APD18634.1 helix-turn-helix DNA binding protein [Streptomyces phage PapayaSalad]